MSEASVKKQPQGNRFSLLRVLLAVVILAAILVTLFPPGYPRSRAYRIICMSNLKMLGVGLSQYASDYGNKYPPAATWCDLLADGIVQEESFHCRAGDRKCRCDYALNPNADPCGAPDVVLLFESCGGWNLSGGPELLTTERHKGCSVLFVDGSVIFVKPEEIAGLKWVDEKAAPAAVRNARRPQNDAELKYWLENMVWHHGFTPAEIQAATGLTEQQVLAAQEKFDLRPGKRPVRAADAPLLVLPYPGGRHPRIGFLEGAVDPQRETKFSVFTPWDPNSYVVVDVPEAIWSNLGLTYLAHTHIDTIWTKQGMELPKLEWNRRADGSLDIERKLPNGIAFGVKAVPGREAVRMEMWLENGTDEKLTDLRVQICVMTKMAAGFAGQTNENKVLTNPYVACRSEDGRRWIITAWEGCHRPWANEQCPCFHSDPKFPDLEPGRRHRLRGWLSFFEGEDVQAEFARIEATGWRD